MNQMRFNCTSAGEIASRLGSICTEEFQNNETAVARRTRTAWPGRALNQANPPSVFLRWMA
ncbi:hypothetical protein CCR91_10355 [Thiorhodovibrio winogradskyi]|nr:hypothetical protein [Thiorhodovibrio winogradskyi]